jgi:Fe-S-cluster containining protein
MDPAVDGVSPAAERRPAGEFGAWLSGMQAALRGEQDSDVPCDGCTACCTSSQFVHVAPEDVEALAVIPPELLFPAPGQPDGHFVMGYDQDGCCPMLVDGGCSIYAYRPRTCRVYDCRLFAAVGRANEATPLIAQRIRSWEFEYADEKARRQAADIRAAGHLPT